MASWATWGALVVGLSLAAGCEGEKNRFPPPQPYPSGTSGDPGAGGGGAGGTGGASTTGTPAEANLCECIFGTVDSTACGSCVSDATAPTKACEDAKVQCETDPDCKSLLDCRLMCVGLEDPEKVACIQTCYGKVDLSDPANHAFVNVTDCLCDTCAIKCAPPMAIACE